VLLEGRTMVVSGVGPGLGREVAAAAHRDGASVMMGARREENLRAAADSIDTNGDRVGWRRTDITVPADCDALVAAALDQFGRVDALVNVAALDTVMGGLDGVDLDEWQATIQTNLFGTLRMCQAAIPPLKERGGSIIFISSQNMYWPATVMQTAYAASKGALRAAMLHMTKELGPYKIRVNSVVPTWMWGPPVEGYVDFMSDAQGVPREQVIGDITQHMPLGEIPTDGDVADAVVFFASDRARMISGQALLVNAGEFPH